MLDTYLWYLISIFSALECFRNLVLTQITGANDPAATPSGCIFMLIFCSINGKITTLGGCFSNAKNLFINND